MTDDIRRPSTRYILTKVAGVAPGTAECATLSDVYWAMERWWPNRPWLATLYPTEMQCWDGPTLLASMREVFE